MEFKLTKDTDFTDVKSTNYYQWLLSKNLKDIHSIKTKTEYLSSLGFVLGEDRLEEGAVRSLKFIEDVYFREQIRRV